MEEFYAKYLPSVGEKPFKVSGKHESRIKYSTFHHAKKGRSIYLGDGKAIKAQLFLCSTVYKKGDTIKTIMHNGEVFTNENKNSYSEYYIGKKHFKVVAQISKFACWVEEFSGDWYDNNSVFSESDIQIYGKERKAHDDGSYNLCLIKCPTCENFH